MRTADTGDRCTIVSFHAHPDDEALLTAGTLARAAAEGHRVVLVVATAGELGLAAGELMGPGLGSVRRAEVAASAAGLGLSRVIMLGHPDSGWPRRAATGGTAFADQDPERLAHELAAILSEERADVLTSYDAAGGYGHPDHLQVHRVARRAAELSGVGVLLEATIDRRALLRGVRLLRLVATLSLGRLRLPAIPDLTRAFAAHDEITYVVAVGPHLAAKKSSLRAHASQATADSGGRTLALLAGLPRPLDRWVLGREWFVEVGAVPGAHPARDPFAAVADQRRSTLHG